MRKTYNYQFGFGNVDISEIRFDTKSRDELDEVMQGLQYIFVNREIREEIFKLLESVIPADISRTTGRPGMDLWKILVLGVVRLACKWDYDKIHNMSNNHLTLREMLGHNRDDWKDSYYYELQTIKDNVSLLPIDIIDKISEIVVKSGHKLLGGKKKEELHTNVDSFVVKTNVHYPTDINLLYDSIRKLIILVSRISEKFGDSEWRQSQYQIRKIKRVLQKIQKAKRSKAKSREEKIKEAHKEYLELVLPLIAKVKNTIDRLSNDERYEWVKVYKLHEIEQYLEYSERQVELIERRMLKGEIIPHKEKLFSIFEPYTRWISKGKQGVPVEFGLPVTIIKDQHGFILGHEIMESTNDVDVAVPVVERAKKSFPGICTGSLDKAFWSPSNRDKLNNILSLVVMPKKGRLNNKEKEYQSQEEFIKRRRAHSSVESAINGLEHSGLDRCPDRGIENFKRYVSLSILSRNLQTLGKFIREKEEKRQRRRKWKKLA